MLHVRHVRKAKWNKSVEDARCNSGQRAAGDQPAKQIRGISRKREPTQQRHVVCGDWCDADCTQWKKQKRDSIEILAVRQGVSGWIKDIRVKKRERAMERCVPIPIERPSVDVWVTRIGNRTTEITTERPGHDDRQQQEDREHRCVLPCHPYRAMPSNARSLSGSRVGSAHMYASHRYAMTRLASRFCIRGRSEELAPATRTRCGRNSSPTTCRSARKDGSSIAPVMAISFG